MFLSVFGMITYSLFICGGGYWLAAHCKWPSAQYLNNIRGLETSCFVGCQWYHAVMLMVMWMPIWCGTSYHQRRILILGHCSDSTTAMLFITGIEGSPGPFHHFHEAQWNPNTVWRNSFISCHQCETRLPYSHPSSQVHIMACQIDEHQKHWRFASCSAAIMSPTQPYETS